jgi:AraC family transcriptional regulator
MKPTEQIIWLIESRLSENPRLDDIASETGYSRFYISRLFADETGLPFAAYVRGRRLSEAAKQLLGGAHDILSVALGAGYGSHEAFTRAFREQFGVSPEEMRERGRLSPIRFVEPLRMTATQIVPLDPPQIETLPAGSYVGLSRTYAATELGGIPEQWEQFQRHLAGLDQNKVLAAYGLVRNASRNGEDVEYICSIPSGLGLEPGGGLIEMKLPALRIAKFTHRGHIAGIKATTRAAFEEGLPKAGVRATGPIDMIEHYGPDFDPRSGYGVVGLWISVG